MTIADQLRAAAAELRAEFKASIAEDSTGDEAADRQAGLYDAADEAEILERAAAIIDRRG